MYEAVVRTYGSVITAPEEGFKTLYYFANQETGIAFVVSGVTEKDGQVYIQRTISNDHYSSKAMAFAKLSQWVGGQTPAVNLDSCVTTAPTPARLVGDDTLPFPACDPMEATIPFPQEPKDRFAQTVPFKRPEAT